MYTSLGFVWRERRIFNNKSMLTFLKRQLDEAEFWIEMAEKAASDLSNNSGSLFSLENKNS